MQLVNGVVLAGAGFAVYCDRLRALCIGLNLGKQLRERFAVTVQRGEKRPAADRESLRRDPALHAGFDVIAGRYAQQYIRRIADGTASSLQGVGLLIDTDVCGQIAEAQYRFKLLVQCVDGNVRKRAAAV